MQNDNQNDQQISPTTTTVYSPPATPEQPMQPAPLPEHHFAPPPKKSKKKFILSIILILLIVAGGVFYYISSNKKEPVQKATVAVEEKKVNPEPKQEEVDAELAKFITPTTGETWLPAPKKIANPGIYKSAENEATFYEVGKRGENIIVMSVIQQIGDYITLYERSKTGAYTLIIHPDSQATYGEDADKAATADLKDTVAINKDVHYDSLSIPRKLAVSSNGSATKAEYAGLGNFVVADSPVADGQKKTVKDLKKLGTSVLSKEERTYTDTQLTSIYYYVKLPINTIVGLNYKPIPSDLEDYTWSKGYAGQDRIRAITRGCGGIGLGTSVTRSETIKESDLKSVGKTPDGQTIYEFSDPNNKILQKAYEEFKEFAGFDTTMPYANITKDEFISQHGVVIYKDKDGQYLVYTRDQLAPQAGCAKPVVYLYPTTTTSVNVKVGADVKVSIPQYDKKSGWKNVTARPNGQLIFQGKSYDSLFWEGPGIGAYPAITSGSVVPTSQAITTIKSQLNQLGLNSKETNDFIAYWQDKLPSKPYTRLTWLTTKELDQLAPLQITPKPDTVIRVFLDYAGLDQPTNIPAQNLTSIPRKGFTVIEWGGLSPYKLY